MENEIFCRHDFEKMFTILSNNLVKSSDMTDMPETNEWLLKVLEYNVPHGKFTRGLSTALAYRLLSKDLCEEDLTLSYILGWSLEILHSACLICDDIMDESETRRGRPCWYKVGNNGVAAFNDTMMLENIVYKVLKLYFKTKSYYVDLLEIFHDCVLKTVYGQSLDTRTSNERNIDMYNMDLYEKIVKYKTSYYSFYTPIRLAMAMANITDGKQMDEVKSVALKLGFLFQVQDDYLDCFGDCEVTGKIGTDIQDGKCTWLYVTAMEKGTKDQKYVLKKLYGANEKESIEAVKKLYIELELEVMFQSFEEEMHKQISGKIEALEIEMCFPRQIFSHLLNQIYRRSK